ncbi:MAG: glycerol-3-phosphate dehydrogenase/oxidase [Bacteroidota bacterium]
MQILSSKFRSSLLDQVQQEVFDLVVIGGGITGSGIALDAASRGMKVALVEKDDFASGTSSRSTKLIHGGLRYLKQLEIALVREVGSERAIVHNLAPHLVISEKMLLPLVEGGTYGKLATSFGLMVYDFLAGVEGEDKRKMLSKEETTNIEPLLREDIVVGGGFYAEYRTDDARLTIEIIKAAAKYGAKSINYARAEQFLYEDGKIVGVHCKDLRGDRGFDIRSKYVVSAAGPWVDNIRKKDNSLKGKHLFLSKGSHIVVPHEKLPVQHSVYFDVPDGRMIFTIPRHRMTYIGTTDTPYDGDINHVLTSQEDVDYLLDAVNNMFPTVHLKSEDVVSSWAGLRPLIHEEGKSASELSRKDEIFYSDSGLISIAGGKLTGYRKMAERVVDVVAKKLHEKEDRSLKSCHTDTIELGGGPFENAEAVEKYTKVLKAKLVQQDIPDYYAAYLVANYGQQSNDILQGYKQLEANHPVINLAIAEVQYCIEKELTQTPMDFFSRRSGRLYFNIDTIPMVLEEVCQEFARQLNWSEEQLIKERQNINQALHEAANFAYSKTLFFY